MIIINHNNVNLIMAPVKGKGRVTASQQARSMPKVHHSL